MEIHENYKQFQVRSGKKTKKTRKRLREDNKLRILNKIEKIKNKEITVNFKKYQENKQKKRSHS